MLKIKFGKIVYSTKISTYIFQCAQIFLLGIYSLKSIYQGADVIVLSKLKKPFFLSVSIFQLAGMLW